MQNRFEIKSAKVILNTGSGIDLSQLYVNSYNLIRNAILFYKCEKVVLMFSGGKDSLVSTYVAASILNSLGVSFVVYHGDTTIGIPETQDFVRSVCSYNNWILHIRKPPNVKNHYESIVRNYGFPGRSRSSHRLMYIQLKERALRHFVTHECKKNPHAHENVLLISGVRKDESLIRMGYNEAITKDDSRVWCSGIYEWSSKNCADFLRINSIEISVVSKKICISGECCCGTFASPEEYVEIVKSFPSVGNRLKELSDYCALNGRPSVWGRPAISSKRKVSVKPNSFMCTGCLIRNENNNS